jgi:hypothetical protein
MRRSLVSIYAVATFATASPIFVSRASAHSFTREATAGAGAISTLGIAQMANNRLVTAVCNGGNNLEVIVWQYNSGSNTLSREGSAVAPYALPNPAFTNNSNPVYVAATGPGKFVTAVIDSELRTHLTSWGLSSTGVVSELSEAYSNIGTPLFISITALSANQLAVWEYDLQPDATLRSMFSSVRLNTSGELTVFESWQQEPPSSTQIPFGTISKVNSGQVVAGTWYYGTDLQLSSYAISSAGYITPQLTAGTGAVENASLASFGPGSLITAVVNGGGQTEPILWTVDPTTGAFTRGESASISVTSNGYIAAGALDGTPVTGDGAFLRLDAWGAGTGSLADLATATAGSITAPYLAEVSAGLIADAFQNSAGDLEIILYRYQ